MISSFVDNFDNWLVFMKKLFILLFDQLETDGSENIYSFGGGLRISWITGDKQATLVS